MSRTKKDKPKPRNGFALAAMSRKGGPMKHRLEPKQGAKNEQAELLKEAEEETYVCGKCGIGQEIFTRECLNCGAVGTVIRDEGELQEKELKENTNE